jgi:UDP-N-acetylmuramate: L-alanyl-gamma-D-glutamyl-meso-diaminopimelate ligase
MAFDVVRAESRAGNFTIPLPGAFNVQNALGVIILANELGIPNDVIQRALSTFKSVKRRLEVRGEVNGVCIYDDFAHHPTAVKETLLAVRQRYPDARIWAVFEPRSQTCRRRVFEQAFVEAFEPADITIIAPVFGVSRLDAEQTLSPGRVIEGIRARGGKARTFSSTEEIVSHLAAEARQGDRVVIMSNGGFDNIHSRLLDKLRGGKS